MDPLLEQAVNELYAKILAGRAKGKQATPEQIDEFMHARTGGKYGLADAQMFVQSLRDNNAAGMATGYAQGLTFEHADEAAGVVGGDAAQAGMRLQDQAYSDAHPWRSGLSRAAGALTLPLAAAGAAPAALGAGGAGMAATRAALAGGGAGALAGMGASEDTDPGEIAWDAAKGGAFGLAAGPIIGAGAKLARGGANWMRDLLRNQDDVAIERAGRLMPEGLAQQHARQEMVAPGTFLPAGAHEATTQVARGVGSAPHAALSGIDKTRRALAEVENALEEAGKEYDDVARRQGPMAVDTELRDLLHMIGEDYMGNHIGFKTLQRIRTDARERLNTANKANVKETYGAFKKGIDKWLRTRAPELHELDSRYRFLAATRDNYEKLLEVAERSNISHGTNAFFGMESGTIGGHLPASTRGLAISAVNALGRMAPGRSAQAEAVERLLMTPADASMVGKLEGARKAAMQPPPPTPYTDTALPAAGTNSIIEMLNMIAKSLDPSLTGQQQ
jgi:hypothetical protein